MGLVREIQLPPVTPPKKPKEKKWQTNADRIRSMSDEELAELISRASDIHKIMCEDAKVGCAYKCKHHMKICENGGATKEEKFLKWLQQKERIKYGEE